MRRLALALALLVALVAGRADAQQLWMQGAPFSCSADNIGATLTELTGCAVTTATNPQLRYYISAVVAQSTTATAGTFGIRSGTGSNCGTATRDVLSPGGATTRFAAPANTAPPAIVFFNPPLPVFAGQAVCVIGVVTNTTSLVISGYLAP